MSVPLLYCDFVGGVFWLNGAFHPLSDLFDGAGNATALTLTTISPLIATNDFWFCVNFVDSATMISDYRPITLDNGFTPLQPAWNINPGEGVGVYDDVESIFATAAPPAVTSVDTHFKLVGRTMTVTTIVGAVTTSDSGPEAGGTGAVSMVIDNTAGALKSFGLYADFLDMCALPPNPQRQPASGARIPLPVPHYAQNKRLLFYPWSKGT